MNGPVGASDESIYGPAQAPYAEGNSPRALVGNLAHTRIYLTSGWGIACTQDPVNVGGLVLDTITEAVLHLQQAPFTVAAREAGADVTAVTSCGVHTHGVWARPTPAAVVWRLCEALPAHQDRHRVLQ